MPGLSVRALFLRFDSLAMRSFGFHRPLRILVPLLVGFTLAAGCASLDSSDAMIEGPNTGLRDGGRGSNVNIDGAVMDGGGDGIRSINPLCGVTSDCNRGSVPDDDLACEDFDAGSPVKPPPRDGGRIVDTFDAAGIATSDAGGDAGVPAPLADASIAPPLPDASATGADAGIRDAGGDRFIEPPPTVPENPAAPRNEEYACQVGSDSNGLPVRKCVRAGTGDVGSPCSSTNNCRAGLACVGQTGAGQCLPYCCDPVGHPCGDSSRQDGSVIPTFCGQALLLEPGRPPSLQVPVCVPAESCTLLKPYPCTKDCECQAGTACTLVGHETTGCFPPGTGKVGDACPCAAGFYCHKLTQQCVKMCATSDATACSPGKCQATSDFPVGFGICVGREPTLQ